MIKLNINSNEAGQRFDKYLKKLFKKAPNSFIYKMLRKKNIVLNGKKADGTEILILNDEIKFFLANDTFQKFCGQFCDSDYVSQTGENTVTGTVNIDQYSHAYKTLKNLNIIYEDANILIVDKPAGILSQKAEANDISVNEWLIGYMLDNKIIMPNELLTFKPSICNRLDRNTSGIVICGKTLKGSQYVNSIIKDKSLEKYYYCIVDGNINLDKRITGYLYKDKSKNKVIVFNTQTEIPSSLKKDISYIDTSFQTIKTINNLTLLEAQIYTGKTHQIRAHLASIGHPIIGDYKYGNRKVNMQYEKMGVKFYLLHAHKLVFPSVLIPEFSHLSNMVINCRLPDNFIKLLY